MGRIANILDLPLDQKLLIVSVCLSVEFLSQLVVEQSQSGATPETVREQTFDFVKKHFGTEVSHAEVNILLKKVLASCDLTL
jgi:hypothetical protein